MSGGAFTSKDAPAIVEAIETNLHTFGVTYYARWSQIEVYDLPHYLSFKCDVPSPMFNVVQRTRLSNENVDEAIASTQALYSARDLPLNWWVEPSSRPFDLSRRLTGAGFTPAGEMAGMALALDELAAPASVEQIEIMPVTDLQMVERFVHTLHEGFQMPENLVQPMITQAAAMGYGAQGPLINYMAVLDGRPVATSTLFVDNGIAGIYNVATLPEMRRRGLGTAVTLAPLLEARKQGCRLAILHASKMARPLYQRLGFDTYGYFHLYLWPAAARDEIA